MLYYLTATGLIAHTIFWGLGLIWLIIPREWRWWSWVFVPAGGFALQSAVVWAGAHTALAGTDAYAWASELIPATLLVVACWRKKYSAPRGLAGVAALMLAMAWLVLAPLAERGRGLTSSSLGSCDHADYAAGARVFQEFSRDDRIGFLGQPEVTRVRSTDSFFDFWLRLNHFTPSALMAHHATILGVDYFRLVSVLGGVLSVLSLPLVFFLARAVAGLRGAALWTVVALRAVSPIALYAVYQGALGQLLAEAGIAMLTLAVVGALRAAEAGRTLARYGLMMGVAIWLLAGSYNFILLVCLAPAGAWLTLRAWLRRDWRPAARVLAWLVGASVGCAILFWGRFDGLVERFSLFAEYNFGWPIPLLSPEGWLGVVQAPTLVACGAFWRILLLLLIVAGLAWNCWIRWRRRDQRALAPLALVLPVTVGWAWLAWQSRERPTASYDAYKLVSVFLPGLLAGLGAAFMPTGQSRRTRGAMRAVMGALIGWSIFTAAGFSRAVAMPPLRLNREIVALGELERDARVRSVNMLIDDFWARLWANALLLRLPQHFAVHSYEGRLNGPLNGEWDLSDSLIHSIPSRAEDAIVVNSRFHLERVGAPGVVRGRFREGWFEEERVGDWRWRWMGRTGNADLHNGTEQEVRARVTLRAYAIAPRELKLLLNGTLLKRISVGNKSETFDCGEVLLPPGGSQLRLETSEPAVVPGGGDRRAISVAVESIELLALP